MGPSWDYVLIGIVVVIVLLAVIATAFRHRRGGHRVEQPHDVEGPRRRPDGSRPEHLDPDP
jgi:hypothetical protein